MIALLLAAGPWGMSIPELAKLILLIAGICAVVWVVLKALGINLPDWFVKILLIILAVFVGYLAINLLASM